MLEEKKPRKDKRSDRTKSLISDALQTLLQKGVFSGITVNDICIEAEVSRATFYLYFEDKYVLLRFTIARWGNTIQNMAVSGDLRSLVGAILDTMATHRKEINNILVADRNAEVQSMINTNFALAMITALEKQKADGTVLQVPAEALAVFCAGGVTYSILWWLERDDRISRDEMRDYLVRIAEGTAILKPVDIGLPSDSRIATA